MMLKPFSIFFNPDSGEFGVIPESLTPRVELIGDVMTPFKSEYQLFELLEPIQNQKIGAGIITNKKNVLNEFPQLLEKVLKARGN